MQAKSSHNDQADAWSTLRAATGDARLREIALMAARAGAAVVREHAASVPELSWEVKSPSDFVSLVDREAEVAVRAVIAEHQPDAAVLGEELSPDTDITRGIAFVTDPLDGTTNFLHQFPWYATSVGVLVDGQLAAGAIVNAATGETFVAARSLGAQRVLGATTHDATHNATHTGTRAEARTDIRVSAIEDPMRSLIGTGFPFKHVQHLPRYQAQFASIAASTAGMRRAGAAALDLCDVACGRFQGFWELELAPWDVAAGILIIREAGGRVTDFEGVDVGVVHGPIVASNGVMHEWLLRALAAT